MNNNSKIGDCEDRFRVDSRTLRREICLDAVKVFCRCEGTSRDIRNCMQGLDTIKPREVTEADTHCSIVNDCCSRGLDRLNRLADLALPIEMLELPTHIKNDLIEFGKRLIESLVKMTARDVLNVPGVGPLGLEKIKKALKQHGLTLADIEELGLSAATTNALKSIGITTITELSTRSESYLLRHVCVGRKRLKEVKKAMLAWRRD